jgi:hypothetical protein
MSGLIETRIGFGKAILSGTTVQCHSFKVTGPWQRDNAQVCGQRRSGTATMQNVGAHGNINGTLYSDTVSFPPGTILLLTCNRSASGTMRAEGAILLRLRPGAALLNVMGKLPIGRDNLFGSQFSMFQGPADILSVDEAEVLGVRVPRGFVAKFFQADEIEDRFEVLELHPETSPRPGFAAVSTPTGVEVKEIAATPGRRMRLRRD